MPVVSLDALAQRRALKDKIAELEAVKRRLQRTENALRALHDVLAALPDPVEVIGVDLLVHFANAASRDRHGDVEGQPYYAALLGQEAPPEDCPVQVVLREGHEVRMGGGREGARVEIVLVPTTLSGGQRAVVRHTRPVPEEPTAGEVEGDEPAPATGPDGAVEGGSQAGTNAAPAPPAFRDVEWMRRVALASARTLAPAELLAEVLPVLSEAFDDASVVFFLSSERGRSLVYLSAYGVDDAFPPPRELVGDGYTSVALIEAAAVPYVHIAGTRAGSELPDSLRTYLTQSRLDDAVVMPLRTPRGRLGAIVIGRRDSCESLTGPQDQLLRALPEILGTAVERNAMLRSIERGITALLNP